MRLTIVLFACFAAAAAEGHSSARSPAPVPVTTYPFVASLLRNPGSGTFAHRCAGTIVNNRAVLTAARCVVGDQANRWRFRLGSASITSGGTTFNANDLIVHDYDEWSMMNDIAIVRTGVMINFSNSIRAASIGGPNYVVPEYQPVTAIGWGYLGMPGWTPSEYSQLRRFQAWAINLNTCRNYYMTQGVYIQYSMFCSGFPYVGANSARDKCFGEPGGPLIHGNNVVVGIRSWAHSCNNANAPAVNTHVGTYASWIDNNA